MTRNSLRRSVLRLADASEEDVTTDGLCAH